MALQRIRNNFLATFWLAILEGLFFSCAHAYAPNAVIDVIHCYPSEAVTTRDYTWGLDLDGLQSGTWSHESGGIGGLLAITEITGSSTNILLPICDHVGTIHALVAAMTNSVALSEPIIVEIRTYSPYGELIEVERPLPAAHCQLPTVHCPFGFQSKYYDPETGFWYYGYRYYDAKSCKWLTADPLQEAGGHNLTAFCGGDPVNQIDPLGLAVWGDLDYDVDRSYRQGRPFAAFFYEFGVRAWNGFSFGMLQRQSRQEDALAGGDISLGRYAAGASVNMAISGAQLALIVGGVARADAQVLVNQQPVLRDGRRFVFALPLRQGSSAHVTNLTVLARVSNDDEGGG